MALNRIKLAVTVFQRSWAYQTKLLTSLSCVLNLSSCCNDSCESFTALSRSDAAMIKHVHVHVHVHVHMRWSEWAGLVRSPRAYACAVVRSCAVTPSLCRTRKLPTENANQINHDDTTKQC